MRRHRSTYNLDQTPQMDGDGAFVGVDMVLAPDKLPSGMVAFARNRIFEDGESRVRPGCASMAWSNPMGANFDGGPGSDEVTFEPVRANWVATMDYTTGDEVRHEFSGITAYFRAIGNDVVVGVEPQNDLVGWNVVPGLVDTAFFNDFLEVEMFGAGRFSDPVTGYEWMVMLLADRAIFGRQFQFPQEFYYPAGVTLAGQDCHLTQAYERLILWRGEVGGGIGAAAYHPDREPLTFTFAAGWQRLSVDSPNPGDPTERLPNAARAIYFGNRLWVPFARDSIAVGDILSLRWDPALNEEAINAGESDALTALYQFDRTTVLAFKERQVYALLNAVGDLSDMRLAVVSREIGAIAPDSVAGWGRFVAFLGDSGIWTVEQVDQDRVQVQEKPLSYPLQPFVDGINWNAAAKAQSIVHDGRLFVAVPHGNAVENDTVLVYNINRGVWEGHWTSENWKVRRWVVGQYFGKSRLFFWHADGFLVLTGDGDEDEIGPTRYEIASDLHTRGYNAESPERLRGLRLLLNMRSLRSSYSAEARAEPVSKPSALATARTPSETRRRLIGQKPWLATNANNDANHPGREDYTARIPGPAGQFFFGSGVALNLLQETEQVFALRRSARYLQGTVSTTRGQLVVQSARLEARPGRRDSREKGYS